MKNLKETLKNSKEALKDDFEVFKTDKRYRNECYVEWTKLFFAGAGVTAFAIEINKRIRG